MRSAHTQMVAFLLTACAPEKGGGAESAPPDEHSAESGTTTDSEETAETAETAETGPQGETAETGPSEETGEPDPCVGEGEDAEKRAITCAMVAAAESFLASLDADQLAEVMFSMEDSERMDWDNRPNPTYPREGLAFEDMSADQLALAYTLLEVSLSASGYERARDIIAIDEEALLDGDEMMGERYYHIDLFGTPSMDAAWGLQLDGHHLAINWTISGAEVTMTPAFYGVRPREVPEGDLAGVRVLAPMEDRAFALLDSLDEDQRTLAVTGTVAPSDIAVGPHMDGLFPEESIGIRGSELSVDQQVLLLDLIDAYVSNMPNPQGEAYLSEVGALLDDTWFAWMGSTDGSTFFYYRVAGPNVWLELDVIGSMDHAHAIWRDPLDDYGADLLAEHFAHYDHGYSLRTTPLDIRALCGVDATLVHPLDRRPLDRR